MPLSIPVPSVNAVLHSSHPPYKHRVAQTHLLLVPFAGIGISLAAFACVLPGVIFSIQKVCNAGIGVGRGDPLCFITTFFKQCLSTSFGGAIIASLLALVAALLTNSYVESTRPINQRSRIITNPAIVWLFVNASTGAVVIPLVLAATIRTSKKALSEQQKKAAFTSRSGGPRSPVPESLVLRSYECHIGSHAETFSIAIAVAFGFVLPSIMLLWRCTSIIVGVWNLFPVYVSILHWVSLLILRRFGSCSMNESGNASASFLIETYGLPIILCTAAHLQFLYLVVFTDRDFSMTPALQLMTINFYAIVFCRAYWILIETSWRILAVVLLCTLIFGPGTGLCIGWILKEIQLNGTKLNDESEPLLPSSDAIHRSSVVA